MSNNIAVTEGAGKTVATEDIASAQYQKIKVVDGTASGTTGLKINADGSITASIYGVFSGGNSSVTAFMGGAWTSSVVGTVTVSSIVGSLPAGVALIGGITSVIGAHTLYAQPDSYVFGVSSLITKTTADSVLSAPGASLRNFITQITVTNGSATATHVLIKDSGAGVMHAGYAAASGGGFSASFPVPLRQATQNASVDMVSSAQASITTAISGYKAA